MSFDHPEYESTDLGLIIPSLKGFAGEMDLEDVTALNLSPIEGAETLDIPLVGHMGSDEDDAYDAPSAYSATSSYAPPSFEDAALYGSSSAYSYPNQPSYAASSSYNPWDPAAVKRPVAEPTYHFGMKRRAIRYDQSFFI